MLSPEHLRRIDHNLSHLTDDEIVKIRDSLYDLGRLIFDDWIQNNAGSKYPVRVLQRLADGNRIESWEKDQQQA